MRSRSERKHFSGAGNLDVAQLVAHLVRDQEVAGSSPVIQTSKQRRPSVFPRAPLLCVYALSRLILGLDFLDNGADRQRGARSGQESVKHVRIGAEQHRA